MVDGEFSAATGLRDETGILISRRALPPARNGILLCAMHWRSMMRELSAEARLQALTLSGRATIRIQKFALYGAFALIAAIVFGSLSIHPF
jgi:hypothetical protein